MESQHFCGHVRVSTVSCTMPSCIGGDLCSILLGLIKISFNKLTKITYQRLGQIDYVIKIFVYSYTFIYELLIVIYINI